MRGRRADLSADAKTNRIGSVASGPTLQKGSAGSDAPCSHRRCAPNAAAIPMAITLRKKETRVHADVTRVVPEWSQVQRSQEQANQRDERQPRALRLIQHDRTESRASSELPRRRSSLPGCAASSCRAMCQGLCPRSQRTMRLSIQRALASVRPLLREWRRWFERGLRVRSVQTQGSARRVQSESHIPAISRKECAQSGVGDRFLFGTGLGLGQSSSRSVAAALLLRRCFVALGTALWAILMPMRSPAPAARSPFIAPFLIGLRTRPLGVGRLRSLLFAAHCEGMSRVRVCLELTPNVARFGIAENAASCGDGKREIAHTGIKRKLDVK
eukprot:1489733-Pleurochrysis_carterae.AAC.2